MSILSKFSGVHINPLKGQASLSRPDPIGAVKDVAQNPIGVAGAILGGLAIPGIGGALGSALGSIPGASAVGGALSSLPGAGTVAKGLGALTSHGGGGSAIPDEALGIDRGLGGTIQDAAGGALDWLKGNHGQNALGAAQALNTVLQTKKAQDLAKDALGAVKGSYAERAPLRAQGLSILANTQAGNPYASGAITPTYGTYGGGY